MDSFRQPKNLNQNLPRPVKAKIRSALFQDLPLLDARNLLTIIESGYCDKQVVNELVYRWCRIVTRIYKSDKALKLSEQPNQASSISHASYVGSVASSVSSNSYRTISGPMLDSNQCIMLIDLVSSINIVRLATVLKMSQERMGMIKICRGSKINNTLTTIHAHLLMQSHFSLAPLKLIIIYHDEFYINRTLRILVDLRLRCQIVLIVPRLNRQNHDYLNTIAHQIIRCDFVINRRDILARSSNVSIENSDDRNQNEDGIYQDSDADDDKYLHQLNRVVFYKWVGSSRTRVTDQVCGELTEDGLALEHANASRLCTPRLS